MKNINRAILIPMFLLLTATTACLCLPPAQTSTESPLSPLSPLAGPLAKEVALQVAASLEAPVPEAGQASISGILYSYSTLQTVPGTSFYLTPAVGPEQNPPNVLSGYHAEEGDIIGMTGNKGEILLNDIPPGSYYLAVWAPYSWLLVVESDTNQTPRMITLEPDQQVNLNMLYIAWP